MKYTEQDVERVAEALCVAEFDNEYWETLKDGADGAPDAHTYQREVNHYLVMARAALEAIEREPLEDVLNDARIYDVYVLSVTLSDGTNAWEAQIMEPKRDRRWATGATIDEAIRRAVKAAKGGE